MATNADHNKPEEAHPPTLLATDRLHLHVAAIASEIQRAVDAGTLTRDDLRTIYHARLQRYLSDDSRIWTSGSVLLPLAITTVGVLAVTEPGVVQLVSLGFASVFLAATWCIFSDHHRGFQQRSQAWLLAIERVWGVDVPGPEKAELRPAVLARQLNIRRLRWGLVGIIALFWLVAGLLWSDTGG